MFNINQSLNQGTSFRGSTSTHFFALEAHVVRILFHGVGGRVFVFHITVALVFQTHQSLSFHVGHQFSDWIQNVGETRVIDGYLKILHNNDG